MERKKVLLMEAKGVVGASAPQWIPVAERFPENSAWFLICKENKEISMDYYEGGGYWAVSQPDEVTHWMPMPEPPKAGE